MVSGWTIAPSESLCVKAYQPIYLPDQKKNEIEY